MYHLIDLIIDLSPFIFTFVFFTVLFIREWTEIRIKRDRLRLERAISERGLE